MSFFLLLYFCSSDVDFSSFLTSLSINVSDVGYPTETEIEHLVQNDDHNTKVKKGPVNGSLGILVKDYRRVSKENMGFYVPPV